MDIFKIVIIAVIGVTVFFYLKTVNSELATLSLIASGVVLILTVFEYVISASYLFLEISSKLNVDGEVFKVVLKIIIISYLIEFTENLCNDLGATSLGSKVSVCGKIIILVTATPVFVTLTKTLLTFIK